MNAATHASMRWRVAVARVDGGVVVLGVVIARATSG
jgi:hypothetical protein